MSDSEKLPLSAFMPHHPSSNPHAPFTAKAGKKNNICSRKIELSEVKNVLKLFMIQKYQLTFMI